MARQKEVVNFHGVAAALARHGFASYKLDDDWQGADFLAYHMLSGETLRVQLKSRCTIQRAYLGKDLWIAFPYGRHWCVTPHDALHDEIFRLIPTFTESRSWRGPLGRRSMRSPPVALRPFIESWLIETPDS